VESNKLLSAKETAVFLDVPLSTLYERWRLWGLTAHRVGRGLKFRERDLEKWLDSHKMEAA
jgi:excisionase family DNA binding protein